MAPFPSLDWTLPIGINTQCSDRWETSRIYILISTVWNFVWNSHQNIRSFLPRKRRNFELLNFVHSPYIAWERDVTVKMCSFFFFWYFNLIAEPHRNPNQSRRLPFALALRQLAMVILFLFFSIQKHHFPLHLSICSFLPPAWEYRNKRIKNMH